MHAIYSSARMMKRIVACSHAEKYSVCTHVYMEFLASYIYKTMHMPKAGWCMCPGYLIMGTKGCACICIIMLYITIILYRLS